MAFSVMEVFRYYGRTSFRTEQSLEIVPVDPGDGKLLGLSEGDPILLLERRDFDEAGRPLAFFRYRTRGDVCDLRVSFRCRDRAGRLDPAARHVYNRVKFSESSWPFVGLDLYHFFRGWDASCRLLLPLRIHIHPLTFS